VRRLIIVGAFGEAGLGEAGLGEANLGGTFGVGGRP